ncbi:MAG: acyltransferase [Ardenticatenaceae bacterium]
MQLKQSTLADINELNQLANPLYPDLVAPPDEAKSEEEATGGSLSKVKQLLHEELGGLHGRYLFARLLLVPLPNYTCNRVRVHLLRLFGFKGISSKAMMWGLPTITGTGNIYERLKIGAVSRFNIGCLLNLGADVTIGEHVAFGQQVTILTETHEIGPASSRSGPLIAKPVKIGNGCWIGAHSTIFPGVTIGSGVIVGTNAVVTKDVPPNTLVAGVPARVVRKLLDEERQ